MILALEVSFAVCFNLKSVHILRVLFTTSIHRQSLFCSILKRGHCLYAPVELNLRDCFGLFTFRMSPAEGISCQNIRSHASQLRLKTRYFALEPPAIATAATEDTRKDVGCAKDSYLPRVGLFRAFLICTNYKSQKRSQTKTQYCGFAECVSLGSRPQKIPTLKTTTSHLLYDSWIYSF